MGLSDQLLSDADSSRAEPSTIRSQNFSEADDAARIASTVAADYNALCTLNDSSGMNSAASTDSKGVVPVFATGHAFLQRRAKLGKPIPIHDRIETRSADQIESIRPSAEKQNFNVARNAESIRTQTPVVPDGISFGAAGWQTAPNSSVAASGTPTDNMPSQNGLPPTTDAWNSDGLQNSNKEASINTEHFVPASQFDSKDAPPEDTDAQASESVTSSEVNTEDSAVTAATATQSNSVAKEPTVLDRLRGLYAPRRDEAALEQNRRANRRWTDPFGLMREREPEVFDSPLGATSPVPSNLEASPVTTPTVEKTSIDDNELLLEPLIAKVEQQLVEWPRQTNGKPENEVGWRQHQTDLRLLYMMAGRSAASVRTIDSLPEKEQEFWQTMMLAMEAYRGTNDSTARTEQLTETLEYVRTAARQLQPLSAMKIRRMNFCDRIEGFGNFNVFPISDFNAGQPLLLYAEIENYKSELTDDGHYRSEFSAMIEFIRDGETEPNASRTIRLPEIQDRCAAERTDYFQSYELTIPALSPGRYTLRLRVRDQLSLQTATSDLPFEIRSLGGAK